jgi:hypothetical protein
MSNYDWDIHSLLGKQKLHKFSNARILLEEIGEIPNEEGELRDVLLSIFEHWKSSDTTESSKYEQIDIIMDDEHFRREFSKEMSDETRQSSEIKGILKRLKKVENKLNFIETTKVIVKDFSREMIDKYKEILLERTKDSKEIDPWEFAEQEKIEIDLSLTCFDELISEGRLEKVNEQDA